MFAGFLIRKRNRLVFVISFWTLLVFFVAILGTGGFYLLINPYRQRAVTTHVEVPANVPFVAVIDGGEVSAAVPEAGATLTVPGAMVTSSGVTYDLSLGEYKDTLAPWVEPTYSLILQRSGANEIALTRFWRKVTIDIPENWTAAQSYRVSDGKLSVDMRKMKSSSYQIFTSNGDLFLMLPTGEGDKKIVFRGEGKYSGRVTFDKTGPSYRILDKSMVLGGMPKSFEKVNEGEYLFPGEKSGEVLFEISPVNFASSIGALEVEVINQHNE